MRQTGFLPQDSKHYVSKVIGSKGEVFRRYLEVSVSDIGFLPHMKYLCFITREDDQSYLNIDMQLQEIIAN